MDPFTISLLLQAGNAAKSAYDSGQAKKDLEREAAEQDIKRNRAIQNLRDVDFSPGSGIYELEQQQKLAAELKGSEGLRRQDEDRSRAISALSEDPRNVGATLRMTGQDQSDAILARQGQEKINAKASTVQAEEKARMQKTALDQQIDTMLYQEAAGSADVLRGAAAAEDAASRQAISQGLGDAAELAMTIGAENRRDDRLERQGELEELKTKNATDNNVAGEDTGTDTGAFKTSPDPTPDYSNILDSAYTGDDPMSDSEIDAVNQRMLREQEEQQSREMDRDANQELIRSYSSGPYVDPLSPEGVLLEEQIQNEKYGIDPTGERRRRPRTLNVDGTTMIPTEDGDYFIDYGDDYADGGKTKGEYDHATNKKAIVDEENGEKEGEMTGGEFILPKYFVEEVEALRKKHVEAMNSNNEEMAEEILEEIGRKYLEFTSADRFQEA